MSVRVSVVPGERTIYSTFFGVLTVVDFLGGRAEVAEHPRFDRTFAHVLDFTAVTRVDVEPQTLRDLAALPSIFERDALQVVVVSPPSPMFTLSQSYRALAEGTGRNLRIVETLDEARRLVVALG